MKLSLSALLLGAVAVQSASAEGPEFTYKSESDVGALSPLQWGQGYKDCSGSRQSPIDITESKLCSVYVPAPWTFDGSCPHFTMTETLESYKVAVDGGTVGSLLCCILSLLPVLTNSYVR
jgi:carbonic anhydrase